ncbi:uncharacterized protein J8A68_006039 [[Candida] subhashii]|uniref:Knr4/Smi1-like domain-containing protein n=1 Tax=[Candida] subhashii TaxID=561895 RepID=A0A8J5Q0U4_9ASCO|nr:uncharacterized protein J8A68_006039 [[Candida] subhashii]KAG7660449.1 hypothetical protein J8A68_006039 [[Candida] subhashii]
MGFLDNIKSFVHSITTDDHYASYSYNNNKNNTTNPSSSSHTSNLGSNQVMIGGLSNSSNSHLNRTHTHHSNNSNHSLVIGYKPGLRSSSNHDLPMTTFDENGQPPLPSIDSLWDRIENWIELEYPELEDNLNDGVTTRDLNEFENDLRIGELPTEFRQFFKRHDGQLAGGKPTGLIMGMELLDLEGIVTECMLWQKVADRLEKQQYILQHQRQQQQMQKQSSSSSPEPGASSSAYPATPSQLNNTFISNQRSIPPNSIQPVYYHKGWLVLLKDNIGNQIAMDLAPGPQGKWGQIIIFGRDFDTKLVIANNLQEFLFQYVNDLELGNYQIDSQQVEEDLGFLSRDRNDDYMIGDEDEGQGELWFFDRDAKEFGKGVIRGNMSYLEILKRRALKKYGLGENYSTQFIPQRIKPTTSAGSLKPSGSSSTSSNGGNVVLNQSRNSSSSNLKPANNKPMKSSPLVNLDSSSSQFEIPKETIIDNKESLEEKKDTQEEQVLPVTETNKEEEPKKDIQESNPEETQQEVNELEGKLAQIDLDKPEQVPEISLAEDEAVKTNENVEN